MRFHDDMRAQNKLESSREESRLKFAALDPDRPAYVHTLQCMHACILQVLAS